MCAAPNSPIIVKWDHWWGLAGAVPMIKFGSCKAALAAAASLTPVRQPHRWEKMGIKCR